MLRARPILLLSGLFVLLLTVACNEPPTKEMHEAQGAIDAARAAGAETYAPEELKAAVDALAHARDAAAERDYRLALNNALDSRERAQNAAKMAASQQAATRSEAERLLADLGASIAVATARLQGADAAHSPTTVTDPLRAALSAAQQASEDARKALASHDYLAARQRLQGVGAGLSAAVTMAGTNDKSKTREPEKPKTKPRD
jgi:hypothetical protein